MPRVAIPAPYRGPTSGEAVVEVDGENVGTCLRQVVDRYPGLGELVFDADGAVLRFVKLFVNGDLIERTALDTPVSGDDEVEILAAIAGG